MKNVKTVKEATFALIIAIFSIWSLYPVIVILAPFLPSHWDHPRVMSEESWLAGAIAALFETLIAVFVFAIFVIKKLRCRKFEVEIYEIQGLNYDEFLYQYTENKKGCEFAYRQFYIFLKANEDYSYTVFSKDYEMIKECKFSEIEKLLSDNIVAGKNIVELWEELEFVAFDSIVRQSTAV